MVWTHLAVFMLGLATGWGLTRLSSSPLSNQQSENQTPTPSPELVVPSPPISSPPISTSTANTGSGADSSSGATASSDVSSLQKALQQMELAYRMAVEMGQFQAGFLARTSHELRSPLNSIMSLQQLILTDLCDSPEEEREFIAQSYTAAQKLLNLLNETTNVSKLEHGSIELTLEPLSLTEMLSELENLTHLQARNRNLQLKIEKLDPDVYVTGDRRWLRQVLINLVTTPLYQMDSGTVYVSVHPAPDAGTVHIWVEDERPPEAWNEPANLLDQLLTTKLEDLDPLLHATDTGISVGLTLAINQILMEKMHGSLVLLASPAIASDSTSDEAAPAGITRVQCSIPLASGVAQSA